MPRKSAPAPDLSRFRRIVVKVGSSLLVDQQGLKAGWLDRLCDDLARLHGVGADILVVSSGAIALGRRVMGLKAGALPLEAAQAAAAIGQIGLARAWAEALGRHGILAGQLLLTYGDTEERRRYLNARATVETLLAARAVPVINENDTVTTDEIRYGDNDRLAARVATMASADCVVLLSDIDGLYTAPPQKDPQARLIPVVPKITAEIEGMAGGAASELSRGGMTTKVEAAKIATAGGAHLMIANGKRDNPLGAVLAGGPCTWFLSPSTPVTARKRWIGGRLKPRGTVWIDEGAVRALHSGKSLLPAGVTRIEGTFSRGDAVLVRGPDDGEVARGLIAFDTGEAQRILGRKTAEIAALIGYAGRSELIHRDNLVLSGKEGHA